MGPAAKSRRRAAPLEPPGPPLGFHDAWSQLLGGAEPPALARRRGRKPRVPLRDLLEALTFHVMSGAGTLSEHFAQLFGAPLADSSWADRRARLPWAIFADLMRRTLRPRATRRHRDAFWRGWRLLAIDGTQFSLINTPPMAATTTKARTRRGPAAFAKITTTVLLELGLHNPLAAAIGRRSESEWALAGTLLAQLPQGALLLADRLYGVAAFARAAQATCQRVGSHLLLRVRRDLITQRLRRLPDGSQIVRVPVRAPGRPTQILEWLELREIRVRVGRRGYRAHELRLWTTLLDAADAPALELAQLYARRWEHEVYFRELKRQLHKTALLQSHTVETAAQEIAALVIASALIATERARTATGQTPVLRISFGKVLDGVRALWLMLDLFDDLIPDPQKATGVRRMYAYMGSALTPARRSRSCPRAIRQPTKPWPRLLQPSSIEGPFEFTVVR